jgi:hypothetical protein
VRTDKRSAQKSDKKAASRVHKRGIVGYSKKTALLEEAISHMNSGKYGRSSASLKELLALDPQNTEARRLFATLHLRLGSLVTARQAFESLANEAIGRQDYWLAESLLREYLAAGPRCVPFLEQLAHVYQEKGDEMAAVVELGKAIEVLRDDPDPDHPQKAAELYSKIRELAPASSVAFQLASLFDVQTGEFLVCPSAASLPPSDNDSAERLSMSADSNLLHGSLESPLPEVMPWEVTDEAAAVRETQPQQAPTSDALYVAELPPPPAEDDQVQMEAPSTEGAGPESVLEDTSFSFPISEPALSESPSHDSVYEVATSESLLETPPSIPPPMPWEQMANASVQILAAENPHVPAPSPSAEPDRSPSLESILASLRSEENGVTSPLDVSETPLPAPIENEQTPELKIAEENGAGAAALPAPMPWEQISDPAIQIAVADAQLSRPLEELSPSLDISAPESSPSLAPPDVGPASGTGGEEAEGPSMTLAESSETCTRFEAASPSSSSFTWNSVFDKAWKSTGGTGAPTPTTPPSLGLSSERHDPEPWAPPADGVLDGLVTATPSCQEDTAAIVPAIEVSDAPIIVNQEVSQAECAPLLEPLSVTISAPSSPPATSSHWNTGEVAVQVHRPSKKRKPWDKEPEELEPPDALSSTAEPLSDTRQEAIREWKTTTDEPAPAMEMMDRPPADLRPEWMQASESITFERPKASSHATWSDAAVADPAPEQAPSAATISAVNTLFSTAATVEDFRPRLSWSMPRPRFMARLHRVRIAISSFVGSCFSTTRSLTFLALTITIAMVVVAGASVGAVGLLWMAIEEPPTLLYQTLTISPPRVIADVKKNGYFLLLGFDAPASQDPVQAGYERRVEQEHDWKAAHVCMDEETTAGNGGASDHLLKGWVRSRDALAHLRAQSGALKSLSSREPAALTRYQQWLTMPFDDWGFGKMLSPNCTHILRAHRLFLLDGFNQDLSIGIDRLEDDMQAWRGALGQSRTLATKMLAVAAVQDDASVASGLLSRVDLDAAALARLSKIVRPLDQVELSVRWPMQSQFVWATAAVPLQLREDNEHDRPWHASLVAAMHLPVQRRANGYAEYYEAVNKAAAGGRFTNLPKVSSFVRTPAYGVMDYLVNPLEHIVGIEPLPSWDAYVMRMVEVDAQLRLAGLQAWLRRGPQEGDVVLRLAKAGQAYYDPFTGLPMLVNQRRGVIYSVGRDGKDQEGDDLRDVTAMIPLLTTSEYRRPAGSSSLR